MKKSTLHLLASALLLLGLAAPTRADRFELADGSVVNGKLLSADGGTFKVETAFAGTIEIAQAQIRRFTTDEAVHVGLNAGSAVLGRVEATDAGIAVVAADGRLTAATGNVAAVWRAGADSPEVRLLKEKAEKDRRKWAYETAVSISGRSGVSEKFGAVLSFKATLESALDKLVFTAATERAKDNGIDTADRQFGGVDYSSFFSGKGVWYARTSLEKDQIKSLDLRSTTAFGLGRKLIKADKQDLELRLGLSYLYETYTDNTRFESPGADVAFLHSYSFANAKMTNSLTYTPAFEDFGNYRVRHESAFEMPISANVWKLRLGLANDYQSVPSAGVEKLDTTYFTSLILNWR